MVGLGTYAREFARELREAAKIYGVEPLITDDYLEVEAAIKAANPALVLGTQMERAYRQAARHSLRGDFGAGACAGFSRHATAR